MDAWTKGSARPCSFFERPGAVLSSATASASACPGHVEGETAVVVSGHVRRAGGGSLAERVAAATDPSAVELADVDGPFVFARYDADAHRLTLGSDAFGLAPLFVARTDAFVAFCSEYEPLLRLPGVEAALDPDAVAEYFAFGLTLLDKTLLRDVRMFPAATVRVFDGTEIHSRVYDTLDIAVRRDESLEAAARRVGTVFRDVVRDTVEAFPDAVPTLTGGADTRLILSAMTPEQRHARTFETHTGERAGAETDRDVVLAKRLCERAGAPHRLVHIEGGHTDFTPSVFGEHRDKNDGPRLLQGVLGGEILGGCCVDVALFPVTRITRATVQRRLESLFSADFRASLSADPYDTLHAQLGSLRAENAEFLFWVQAFSRPFFTQLYFGTAGVRTNTWMVPWQMHQRVVAPFADPAFLRVLLTVPFAFLSGYRLYNEIYRSVLTDFADVPTNSGLAVRADSALTMYTGGEEPKRVRLGRTKSSRGRALDALLDAGALEARSGYEAGSMERLLRRESEAASRPPSLVDRAKQRYTRSLFFRKRHVLPVHGMLMRWKARTETERAATLEAPLVPAFVDFEGWCAYVDGLGEAVDAGHAVR